MKQSKKKINASNIAWHSSNITRKNRELLNGHKGAIIWFTGLSGSGKSTLAIALENFLFNSNYKTFILDGDNIRHGLCSDLGFSDKDRAENIRRVGEVAKLFMHAGFIVIAAFISPFRSDRDRIRNLVAKGDFIEIYCNCPLEVCEERDVKGLYSKARKGEIKQFTGVSSPYESPLSSEIIVNTAYVKTDVCIQQIATFLSSRGYFLNKL